MVEQVLKVPGMVTGSQNGIGVSRKIPIDTEEKTSEVRRSNPLSSGGFFALVFLVLGWGWSHRSDQILTAESGLGYALGIVGASFMVLLLVYPLAKHARWLRKLIPLRHWFRLHMMLGVLGPLAIGFHSNFRFGSLNSNVALLCMLLVVASGFVGRYIYTKIHLGLYGERANSRELAELAHQQREQLVSNFEHYPELSQLIMTLYYRLVPVDVAQLTATDALLAGPRRMRIQWTMRRAVRKHSDHSVRELWKGSNKTLKAYTDTLRRLAQLTLFERLFSWWHVLHLPFFVMMLLTATLHVWAVHYY